MGIKRGRNNKSGKKWKPVLHAAIVSGWPTA